MAIKSDFASGATYTWFANGSGGSAGGTGNWNTSNLDWTLNGSTFVAWPSSGTTNVAGFGATGGNVTLTGNVSANALNFSASGYSLLSNGGAILTLNGTNPTIDTGAFDVTFGMAANGLSITGGSSINKTGVGNLTITNSQNGAGGIPANVTWNVSGGTLNTSTGFYSSALAIADGSEVGSSTGNILNLNGGSLVFTTTGGAGYSAARTINVGSNGGTISDGGFAPGMGGGGVGPIAPTITITAGNGLNLVSSNILELDTGTAPRISGAGGITVYGNGFTKILSTGNTYQGGTTIKSGAKLVIGGTTSLGAATGNLSVAGTLNLNGISNSITVGKLTSTSGTIDFNVTGSSTSNKISASSAALSGTTGIAVGTADATFTPGGTYTLATSSGGGLTGAFTGSFYLTGGQNLALPLKAVIQTIGGVNSRLTAIASGNGSAVALSINSSAAPAHTISVMPLGSSITAGQSAQNPYDGGGYRSELYQNLVNDGRFTPNFVGSSTATESNNPTGADLMTTVGQTHHEGHPGYTTTDVLGNLNANAGTGGNNGGFWLQSGNGVNPDYITLNIGGNDFASNPTDTTAITRLGQIIDQVSSLRPNATIVVSSVLYRGDNTAAGNGIATLYDPLIPALVYQKVLAGDHVSFVDMYGLITPNNSLSLIGPDLIHPTQTGYNLMGDAWYSAITTGQAFYTGAAGSAWNATSGNTTNWAQDYQRTTDAGVAPSAGTDVYFNGIGGNNTLGTDFSVRSVNFAGNTTTPVTISGNKTLTLGAGGITVQSGAGAHIISSAISLGSDQTWSNVSANTFTVSGNISGSNALTIGGTGVIGLSGNNSYSGVTTLNGGTLSLNSANALAGAGNMTFTGGTLQFTGNNTNDYSSKIVNSTSPITIDTNSQTVTFAGVLNSSNTGGLIKTGNGTLALSNTGSSGQYAGGAIISAGTLSISGTNGLGVAPASPAVNITFAGNSTLQFASNVNFNTFNANRTISIPTAGVTGTIDTNGVNMTAGQLITGNGSLAKAGNGTLTLAGNNTYLGITAISAGTLSISSQSALGSNPVSFNAAQLTLNGGTLQTTGNFNINDSNRGVTIGANGGTFVVNSGNGVNIVTPITGSGNITMSGPGVLTIGSSTGSSNTAVSTANNTFTGKYIINGGLLGITADAALGTAPTSVTPDNITLNGGTLMNMSNAANSSSFNSGFSVSLNGNRGITLGSSGGTIRIGYALPMTVNGVISGNGALTKSDSGTLILTNANTFSLGTTISAGSVRANTPLATGSATGSGSVSVAASTGSGNYSGAVLGGSGNISGTVTLNGSTTAKLGGIITAGADTSTIGKLTTGNETWNGGAAYQWKINAAGTGTTLGNRTNIAGTAGTSYDTLQIGSATSGSLLNVTQTGGLAAFTIEPLGTLTGLTAGSTYNWVIGQVGSLTGTQITLNGTPTNPSSSSALNSSIFALDTSGLSINGNNQFSSASNFSLYFETISGNNDLVLSYNAAPEPGTTLLLLAGTLPTLMRRRRRAIHCS